jgi:hypothetical protein
MDQESRLIRIWPALKGRSPLFRACRKKSERENLVKAHAALFLRRPIETGLSVGLSPEAAVRNLRPFGLFSVTVADVRACNDPLHLAQDEAEHAEIQGMPVFQEDELVALRIALYLARKAIAASQPSPS